MRTHTVDMANMTIPGEAQKQQAQTWLGLLGAVGKGDRDRSPIDDVNLDKGKGQYIILRHKRLTPLGVVQDRGPRDDISRQLRSSSSLSSRGSRNDFRVVNRLDFPPIPRHVLSSCVVVFLIG